MMTCQSTCRRAVKTAHSNFPRAILQSQLGGDDVPRGTHAVATTTWTDDVGADVELAAIGWKDTKVQTFVDTSANTASGEPAIKRRRRFREEIDDGERHEVPTEVMFTLPRPLAVQKAHDSLNAM
jgi:hypothetical protein